MTIRALFRVNFDVCQRSRGGDAVKLSAYNACGRAAHGDQAYDFRRKHHEHVGRTILLVPDDFPRDRFSTPGSLWRAAEAAENRGNSQTARQVLLTIPREVPADLREQLVRHVVAPWVSAGMAAQIDIHDPSARDGGEQPHAHVLLTMRELGADGFAKTKTRGRDWNQSFTADRGRAMRSQVADRMNEFFAQHGLDVTVDHRTNLEVDGPAAVPPEPQVSRADIEVAKRHPEAPPPAVQALDQHRATVREVRKLDRQIEIATRSANSVRQQIAVRASSSPQPGGQPVPTAKINTSGTHWTNATDTLSAQQAAAAMKSWEAWKAESGRGDFGLYKYISYVQDRQRQRLKDAGLEVALADDSDVHGPGGEPGWSRRKRHLTRVLGGTYNTNHLPESMRQQVRRVTAFEQHGIAKLHLSDGSYVLDHGDRLTLHNSQNYDIGANAMASMAAERGWTTARLTGPQSFVDEAAFSFAMLTPPITTTPPASPRVQRRIDAALAARASAEPETDDEIAAGASPHVVAAVAPVTGAVLALAHDAGSGADSGEDEGGAAEATDDELRQQLVAFMQSRVASARATLARRPAALRGDTRAARRSRDDAAEFDAADSTAFANRTLATQAALDNRQDADLIAAVRRSGNFGDAMLAMQDRQTAQASQQQQQTPEQDDNEISRPGI